MKSDHDANSGKHVQAFMAYIGKSICWLSLSERQTALRHNVQESTATTNKVNKYGVSLLSNKW